MFLGGRERAHWGRMGYLHEYPLGDCGTSHNSVNDKEMDILKISAIHSEASQMSSVANHTGKINQISDNEREQKWLLFWYTRFVKLEKKIFQLFLDHQKQRVLHAIITTSEQPLHFGNSMNGCPKYHIVYPKYTSCYRAGIDNQEGALLFMI